MVGKIVVNRHRIALRRARQNKPGTHFHAAFDILKSPQRLSGLWNANTHMFCRGNCGQRVALVVQPAEFPTHMPGGQSALQHREIFRLAQG